MTGVVTADKRHHFLDRQERALEQYTRAQHAQGMDVSRRRRTDVEAKQVRESRRREIDGGGERLDRQPRVEMPFHLFERPCGPPVHAVL
jgi:hypothetical protein